MNQKAEKKEIDVLEYWRIILKRKWVLITFATILVVFAGIFSFTATPLYRATAQILIEEPSSGMLNYQEIFSYSPYYRYDYLGTYFNTQLRLLTSRSLAERISKKMNLASRPELQEQKDPRFNLFQTVKKLVPFDRILPKKKPAFPEDKPHFQADPYAMYAGVILGGLTILPVEETRLVQVSYISPHPVLAADIVNTLTEEFITYSVEARYEATQQASEFLSEQIAQLRDELAAKEKEIQKYGEEKKLLFLNERESTVVSKFAELSTAFTEAQIDLVKKEAVYRELRDLKVDSLPTYVNNPLIQSLKTSYTQIKGEFEEKSKIFGPNYPEMIRLKARLDSMKTELESEISKAVETARSEYGTAQKKAASLQNLLESQRTDVVRMNNNAILYNSLRIEVENKRNLLNSLVARQNETLVSARLGGLRTSNIKIIDRALVPGSPFSPNTRRNLMMALLLGLFGGLALIFLTEYLDNSLKNPEDVDKITGLPSLGIIPYLSPDGLKKRYDPYSGYNYSYGRERPDKEEPLPEVSEIELINHLFPKLSISEDYRTVRTSILFSHAEKTPKVIAFTSTLPQEGKTATVSNVAISFAQLGEKVLLIDGDLRKPRLHRIFKVKNLAGLSGFLAGRIPFEDVLQKAPVENIWIIPSGPHPPDPAELLNSKRMRELMAVVKERFDRVLIDSPPVLAVIDPVIISSLTDSTVFIVRSGKTTRKPFMKAVEEIRKSKSDIIGVVFNEMNVRTDGTYASYHHYYQHEYYEEVNEELLDQVKKGSGLE